MADRRHGTVAITGGRVIDPSQGIDRVADVFLRDGKVERIVERTGREGTANAAGLGPMGRDPGTDGYRVVDARGKVVAPGFVDLHTHLREPGLEYKETIATGTAAAARGGYTTVCAMPNTDPALDTASVVEHVVRRARETGVVRVLPIGAVTVGRQGKQLSEMADLAAAGAIGFSDDGDPVADANLMRQALAYSSTLGLPIIDHCQDRSLTAGAQIHEGLVSARLGLAGWPSQAEATMVARDIALCELTGGRLHIAHVSTRAAVELVRSAKERGLNVTAEATPHHLTLTDEWVYGMKGSAPDGGALPVAAYDTNTKVNPPLRSRVDVEAVVDGLRTGAVDFVATDHAPHAETEKVCTYAEAANGISNIETAFASVMSLVHAGRLTLSQLVERMSTQPARFLSGSVNGRPARKLDHVRANPGMLPSSVSTSPASQGLLPATLGTLKVGAPADVVIFDPDAPWTVDPARFASKGRNTPLAGVTLKGRVTATIYGGAVVWELAGGDV
jgi:dihydroorotase